MLETPLKANAALPALEPLLDDCGRCCRAAGVCLWLKADLMPPEIDFRFAPKSGLRRGEGEHFSAATIISNPVENIFQ